MAQALGKIVQCIGAVVDVEFARNEMPKIYDALKMEGKILAKPKNIETFLDLNAVLEFYSR